MAMADTERDTFQDVSIWKFRAKLSEHLWMWMKTEYNNALCTEMSVILGPNKCMGFIYLVIGAAEKCVCEQWM
jgi:hypothetical protein